MPEASVETNLRSAKFLGFLSTLGIIALFPGFVVYHMVVTAMDWPMILSGFFGPVSAFVLVSYLLFLPSVFRGLPKDAYLYCISVCGFVLFAFLWALTHYLVDDRWFISEAFGQAWQSLVLLAALFFVGMHAPIASKALSLVLMLMLFVFVALIAWYYARTGDAMFYARSFFDAERGASYQGYARSALVMSLLVIVLQPTIVRITAIAIAGLIVTFFLGARSELFGFLVAMVVLFALVGMRRNKYLLAGLITFLFVGLVVVMKVEVLMQSRQFQFLDLDVSSSWANREYMSFLALQQIRESPLLGNFGGHFEFRDSGGAYAHNVLSAWVNYGLLGFIWFIGLIIMPVFDSFRRVVLLGSRSITWLLVLLLSMVCLALVIGAKSVFWPVPGFMWGLYVNALVRGKWNDGFAIRRRPRRFKAINQPEFS